MAIGRNANTKLLNLNNVGIKINENNLKLIGNHNKEKDQASIENVYAIGDVLDDFPELTPIAAKMGKFLAKKLKCKKVLKNIIKKSANDLSICKKFDLDLEYYPTTIFTPLEYSCSGMSEEKAINTFGKENIEVYHLKQVPLEDSFFQKFDENLNSIKRKAYFKIICNKLNNEKIIGMHYLGPNAGEVMQGFSVALSLGLYKEHIDKCFGIHPTTAEAFVDLQITKASKESFDKTSC